MQNHAAGRGGGRLNGRGRGGRGGSFTAVQKGTMPTIGSFLISSNGVNANATILWISKIKEYVIANYSTRIDEIFGVNGNVGENNDILTKKHAIVSWKVLAILSS